MESPIKMDDLGVPLFSETPILILRINKRIHNSRIQTSFKPSHFFPMYQIHQFQISKLVEKVGKPLGPGGPLRINLINIY